MARYIDSEILLKKLFSYEMLNDGNYGINAKAVKMAVENTPTAGVVEAKAVEQIKWERDMAIKQLESYGVGFGEKADVVKVRHGYWELRPSGHYSHVGSFCSVCGKKSGIGGNRENQLKPYCPNCGAKMDGERSSNE